jgi:hypothetical protein
MCIQTPMLEQVHTPNQVPLVLPVNEVKKIEIRVNPCIMNTLAYPMNFALHYSIFCVSVILIITGLVSLIHNGVVMGLLFGMICLLACRCNMTGLLCHLYDNDDLDFVPIRTIEPTAHTQTILPPLPSLTPPDIEMTSQV